MDKKRLRRDLNVIAFTAFLNFIGLTIAIPIFTPLCLQENGGIIAAGTSIPVRTTILGLLVGLFPLCQFFAAPILGAYSDRYGRKSVLLVSLLGMAIGYIIMAVSILLPSLPLAFLSRIIMGAFSGSLAVTQSAMADVSDERSRANNFGLIGAAFGASLFIGPALGGILSDPAVHPWFTYATPFLLAALLTGLNFIQVVWQFSETLPEGKRQRRNLHILIGPVNIVRAMRDSVRRSMFMVVFFLGFGFNFFTQFFQLYLIDAFATTQSQLGMVFSYIGICSILTQILVVPAISKRFRPAQVLSVSLLLLASIFPMLLLVPRFSLLFPIITLIPLFNGLSNPNLTALVSGLGGTEGQGEILGINQSVMAITQFLPPLAGGFIVGHNFSLPNWITAASIITAWFVFRKNRPAVALLKKKGQP
jgi:DHA1 family tetracycline resistance protein-like MFS transporter